MNDDQIFDSNTTQEFPPDFNAPKRPKLDFFRGKKIIIGSIIVVALLVIGFWFFLSKDKATTGPESTNVILTVDGPKDVVSGNEVEYHIVYNNGENADLTGLTLEMFYPSNFKFISAEPEANSSAGQSFSLVQLKQGESGEVVIKGKLSGSTSEDKEIKAKLHYRLSNFNSDFAVEQSFHSSILAPNLTLDINGPAEVVNGQDVTFTLNFINVSSQDFDNLAIQAAFPKEFTFVSSVPAPSRNNNFWTLGKLAMNASGSIEVTGSFNGDTNQDKFVTASLGQMINNNFAPQINASSGFKIIRSTLAVELTSQPREYVNLGDNIQYTIKYYNQGSIGMRNLVVTVSLEGPSLDMSRISVPDAIFSGRTLTWKSATLSNLSLLSPNAKGEISFSVPVKSTLSSNLKNQTIKVSATIASDEMTNPVRAQDLVLKLSSKLGLSVNGDYVSGAAPMEVGKPTLYNLTFLLTNLSNDLSNTEIIASMPLPASSWKNVIIPESEKGRLFFDSGASKIRWKVGDVPAFVGKFSPALIVTFQVEVVPVESDRNKVIRFLTNVSGSAKDTFTGQQLETLPLGAVDSSSINDDVLNTKGAMVQ
jgi:hypothetical protein